MRIYNLTDVETPTLRQYGFVDQRFVVARALIAPGESAEVPDEPIARMALEHLVAVGAAAIDELPPAYVVAKHLPRPSAELSSAPLAAPMERDHVAPSDSEPERPAALPLPSGKSKKAG